MSPELIQRVIDTLHQTYLKGWDRTDTRTAIAVIDAYEAEREAAQDAEDERMYTEFHK